MEILSECSKPSVPGLGGRTKVPRRQGQVFRRRCRVRRGRRLRGHQRDSYRAVVLLRCGRQRLRSPSHSGRMK